MAIKQNFLPWLPVIRLTWPDIRRWCVTTWLLFPLTVNHTHYLPGQALFWRAWWECVATIGHTVGQVVFCIYLVHFSCYSSLAVLLLRLTHPLLCALWIHVSWITTYFHHHLVFKRQFARLRYLWMCELPLPLLTVRKLEEESHFLLWTLFVICYRLGISDFALLFLLRKLSSDCEL